MLRHHSSISGPGAAWTGASAEAESEASAECSMILGCGRASAPDLEPAASASSLAAGATFGRGARAARGLCVCSSALSGYGIELGGARPAAPAVGVKRRMRPPLASTRRAAGGASRRCVPGIARAAVMGVLAGAAEGEFQVTQCLIVALQHQRQPDFDLYRLCCRDTRRMRRVGEEC
jgi:hypothetical protein